MTWYTSWHDHDAIEIVQHAELCIEGAIKALQDAGWAKESVKVIGQNGFSSVHMIAQMS
jgi:glycerol kinase